MCFQERLSLIMLLEVLVFLVLGTELLLLLEAQFICGGSMHVRRTKVSALIRIAKVKKVDTLKHS